MELWTRKRMLRGVISPLQACLWALFSSVLLLGFIWKMEGFGSDPKVWVNVGFGSLSIGILVIAAYIDSVIRILPDPLLLISASFAALSQQEEVSRAFLLAAFSGIFCLQLCKNASLGKGDAKLISVLALLLGQKGALVLAVTGAFSCAGLYAAMLVLKRQAHRHITIALGPPLVGAGAMVWCMKFI